MSRWEYDVVFYRVFCVTLLGIAFTFTVILTNVFVDIDGVLYNKKIQTETTTAEIILKENEIESVKSVYFDDKSDDSDEPSYRTKRSIESEAINVKNLGYKKVLTEKLSKLLDELDKEEENKEETTLPTTTAAAIEEKKELKVRKEDLLHLAIHNILLEGIVDHNDFSEVYRKVHELVKKFDDSQKKREADNHPKETNDLRKTISSNKEQSFLDEIVNCKQLEKDISESQKPNTTESAVDKEDKNLLIKTVIEINDRDSKLHHENNANKENIQGLIRLVYNGKIIKIDQMKDEPQTKKIDQESLDVDIVTSTTYKPKPTKIKENMNQHKKNVVNKFIEEYFSQHPSLSEKTEFRSFRTKRLKRQIKIRYLDDSTTTIKPAIDLKDDDDLYIEIETHYDGNGIVGEKKKKLVRSLIAKIQKALHSADVEENGADEKFDDIKLVKRIQDPIEYNSPVLRNKVASARIGIQKRHLDPIDKTLSRHDFIHNSEDSWKTEIEGPRFLSLTKAINSAEMDKVNIDYDSILKNGIAKRLQVPLNSDMPNENSTSDYSDPNNITLFLKDIDGSGFSIGINQYVGEPPDMESMKMFNGLESLLQEYHQSYDQDSNNESVLQNTDNLGEGNHEINKRDTSLIPDYPRGHKLTRSLKEVKTNYKSFYTTILKNNFPVQKYINIFKRNDGKTFKNNNMSNNNDYKLNISNINVLTKNLNIRVPLIIKRRNFKDNKNMTSLNKILFNVGREKRSINVKKISNMKSKIRFNRYLNTNVMAKKKIFLKNKRNKRQVDQSQIIDKNRPQNSQKNSDENIFLISRENTFSNGKAIEAAPRVIRIDNENEDYDDIFEVSNEYKGKQKMRVPSSVYNPDDTRRIRNPLMSRYPHIIVDEYSQYNGEYTNENSFDKNEASYRIRPVSRQNNVKEETEMSTMNGLDEESKGDEIFNAILPSLAKSKYKITLKVLPKNLTNIGAGFKEVHTSVNKSFDENGLRYFSLVNVSEISKIEKLNETKVVKREKVNFKPLNNHLEAQQKQMNTLLELHKKRVDQQLENLLRESRHLEEMIDINIKNNISNAVSIFHDDVTTEKTNDKFNEVLGSIKKLQETYESIAKEKSVVTTERTEKEKLIDTIKSHEKITYEILKKIDSNTNIFKNFLQMFTEKLESDKIAKAEVRPVSKDNLKENYNPHYVPKEYNNTGPSLDYKQDSNKNIENNIPQVIYEHVDTNTIGHKNEVKNQKGHDNRRSFNESRFFIDDFENDYKLVSSKQFVEGIKFNTTHV